MASTADGSTVTSCLECSTAYFLFEEKCVKRTNVAGTLTIDNNPANGSAGIWSVQASPTIANNNCSVNLPSKSTVNFTISESKIASQILINQTHYKKIIEFYLIKIDAWEASDLLQLYLNDLLVLSKNYSSFGNSICLNSSETDLISF